MSSTGISFFPCCKSGLRKQGLKHKLFIAIIVLCECCKSGLRKQGLKHFISVFFSVLRCNHCCKSGLRKQGLKHLYYDAGLHKYPVVAKVVYENKDWNNKHCVSFLHFLLLRLQKWSTKTRIETPFFDFCALFVISGCKAVYENKDWNPVLQIQPSLNSHMLQSSLRKQGLKQ